MQITVEVPPAFHIFYATGWEEPVLRLRELCADGSPRHEVSPYSTHNRTYIGTYVAPRRMSIISESSVCTKDPLRCDRIRQRL